MTDEDLDRVAQRIADAGRLDVLARLRDALAMQAVAAGLELTAEDLDRNAAEAVVHADGVLWRRALAGAGAEELGLELGQAVDHPAVVRAHVLVGAPPYAPDEGRASSAEATALGEVRAPSSDADAVRVAAVHLGGIEALRPGEGDLELRISAAGLDVFKGSTGAPIGRLAWSEIERIDLPRSRRGLRPGRGAYQLHVATGRGRAAFELPGVTGEQLRDHLEPLLARAQAGYGSRG